MTSAISFGDENTGFQAGVIHGPVNTAFHLPPNLNNVLNSLPFAKDAPFYAYQRQHDPTCLPDTRVDLLREIYSWADGEDSPSIFWLSGLAGTGKSTIARTLVAKYSQSGGIAASFFFSRDGGEGGHLRHAGRFVTSLAVQLANNVQRLKRNVCDAISAHSDIAHRALREQWRHLILSPLSTLGDSNGTSRYILVVDALDECENESDIRTILQLLVEARSLVTVQLRVFLTSRPDVLIRNSFNQIPDAVYQDFILHNISSSIVDHDIRIFLRRELELIASKHHLGTGWPGEQIVEQLVYGANGLFVWAATACRFINEGRIFAADRLSIILKADSADESVDGFSSDNSMTGDKDDPAVAPEQHLDKLYITVLWNSVHKYKKPERKKWRKLLAKTMGSIAVLSSPLSTKSLGKLLDTTQDIMGQTLNDLHAILDIPKDVTHPLRLHHPSFRDFLLDRKRCEDLHFGMDEKQAHHILATRCIKLLSDSLKQDILGIDKPGALVTDIETSHVEQCLPPEVQYACFYWIQHLQKSGVQLHDDNQAHRFLQEHLLHWLEALGWIGKISEGIHAIASLESITAAYKCTRLSEYVHDIKRFVLYNRPAIEHAPLQIYCSALVFTPAMSIVRQQFKYRIPRWIQKQPKVEDNWNAALQTLEGHLYSVLAVAFSPDGKVLASASGDKTVRLWDAGSGAALQTLEGHSGWVRAVAFSPDGKVLASASDDQTVRLWDAGSGAALQTLEGHSNWVRAVAFSPDGKVLASASHDQTVRLWDAGSGAALQTLGGHLNWVQAVAFSPDGKVLASASHDGTVRLWDAGSGAALQTLEVGAVALTLSFSNDGTFLLTNRGPLRSTFLSEGAAVSQSNFPPSVYVKEQWVTSNTENVLWFHSDYRPTDVAVYGSTVGFGCSSGRVLFMEFVF